MILFYVNKFVSTAKKGYEQLDLVYKISFVGELSNILAAGAVTF